MPLHGSEDSLASGPHRLDGARTETEEDNKKDIFVNQGRSTQQDGHSHTSNHRNGGHDELPYSTTPQRQYAGSRKEERQAFKAATLSTMERAASARREIFELWAKVCEWEEEKVNLRHHRRDMENTAAKSTAAMDREAPQGANHKKGGHKEGELIWKEEDQNPQEEEEEATRRYEALQHLLRKYQLDIRTPLEEDVGRGLGDALDRLILLCVPLPRMRYGGGIPGSAAKESLECHARGARGEEVDDPLGVLLQVLQVASRHGRRLTVRLIQHVFARTSNYTEALGVFHTLRRAHFAMNMETYHAMLYSLQRLEEEGWAKRFQEEYFQRVHLAKSSKEGAKRSSPSAETDEETSVNTEATPHEGVSEQGLEFILRGVESPLLPENKPWIGQIMYGNGAGGREEEEEEILRSGKGGEAPVVTTSTAAAQMRQTAKSWDELGELWVNRYKQR